MDQFATIIAGKIVELNEHKNPLTQFMCERITHRLMVRKDFMFDTNSNGPFIPPVYSRMKTEKFSRLYIERSDKELIFDKLTLNPKQTRRWRRQSTKHRFYFCIIRNNHTAFLIRVGIYEFMCPYAKYPDYQFYFKITQSLRLDALLDYKLPHV